MGHDVATGELSGYFEAREPGRRARADAWSTAIGLQQVDGLSTSPYLVQTAKDHIEGRISQEQARQRIHDYYAAVDETRRPDSATEEPDKVAERIAAILNDGGFEFTPEYFFALHRRLFEGVLPTAGRLRTVNIRKPEWVLRDASVTYGDRETLQASLARDFSDERAFDYGGQSPEAVIPHFARFIAQIWQVHPFCEGNTRTTAVFAVKYLGFLGFRVTNNMFREKSWYFRNALVRANYADYARGAKRDWSFLEAFFRNLLLGETNELRSRFLLIGLSERERDALRGAGGGQKKRSEKAVRKPAAEPCSPAHGGKTVERLLGLLKAEPSLTQSEMVERLGLASRSTVQKHLAALKAQGRVRRIGSDRSGHWEVV